MTIEKLQIQNFGKIHGLQMELCDGLNVFFGKNESGKTTFYHFLKGMLYGMPRKRGRGAGKDSYARYEPWENPCSYGGTVWFKQAETKVRLYRNFARGQEGFEMVDLTRGRVLTEEDLESFLGGVSEAVYENTVSIGQLKSVTGPDLTRELTNYMAACQGTADSRLNLEKAVQFLKMQRKGFADRQEHDSRLTRQEENRLLAQIEYIEKDLTSGEGLLEEAQTSLEEAQAVETGRLQVQPHRRRMQAAADRRKSRIRLGFIFAVLTAAWGAGAACAYFLSGPVLCVLAGLISAACLAGSVICFRQAGLLAQRYVHLQNQLDKFQGREQKKAALVDRMEGNLERILQERKEKTTNLENLRQELAELQDPEEQSNSIPDEIRAIDLAMERLREASLAIRGELGSRLRLRTSQILCEITEGRYREVLVDEDFHISVNTPERTVELERLSRGTMEQIYFALRMASGELMCSGQDFPVILDDVFGMYDDERLKAVLAWLARQNRQVIICSCSHREEETLAEENIPFRFFMLEQPSSRPLHNG